MFLFSQPPPLRISLTSISSSSHCSKWITGVSVPRLLPLFLPVIESTELGRSLPSRVASATASLMALRSLIWLTPTGVCTHEGVLARILRVRARIFARHIDVRKDDFECLRGLRSRRLSRGRH